MNGVRLHLVRHGETDAATTNVLDTRPPGLPLSATGIQHAEDLADALATLPMVAVYASLASRAQQTAAVVASRHGLDVQVLHGLHEVQVGEWEGRSDPQTHDAYLRTFSLWLKGDLDHRIPGGESGREVLKRFSDDVGAIVAGRTGGNIAIVSHGAAIRLASLYLATNLTSQLVGARFLPYCGSVILEMDTMTAKDWCCTEWIGQRLLHP